MTWRTFLSRIFRFVDPDPTVVESAGPPPETTPWSNWPNLTAREMQVAWYIRHGFTNEQIALELNITVPTVKSHVHNLLRKFNLRSRFLLQELLEAANYDPWT